MQVITNGNNDLMDVAETCRFFGGSRPINPATLYRGVKSGNYPAPVKTGPNTNRWLRAECQARLDAMIASRTDRVA
jgi:predicted DNA-binding transcriptional regulator AlpA